jgi:hypothetical protein
MDFDWKMMQVCENIMCLELSYIFLVNFDWKIMKYVGTFCGESFMTRDTCNETLLLAEMNF